MGGLQKTRNLSSFGNVSSIVCFAVATKDAQTIRREFLAGPLRMGESVHPVEPEALVTLKPGRAVARLGTGAFAIPLETDNWLEKEPAWRGDKILEASWERYGASRLDSRPPGPNGRGPREGSRGTGDFLE